ncbi:MAG: sugar phosphate nucleotidyltransferase [Pseudomonadota bacterium]
MKVVIFCGGLGTRLREHSDVTPKPLVNIGYRPIVWHLMRYYAYHGHKDFILCLGYRGDLVKEYFLNYRETDSNDFTLRDGGRTIEPHNTDIDDWSITFAETGMHANIGQRLLAVRHLVEDEEMFLANYSDGLSDIPINQMIDEVKQKDAIASFAAVRTWQSFHAAKFDDDRFVSSLGELTDNDFWINGGFFVMRNAIFDYINDGDELVEEPFNRLIEQRKLLAYPYDGFWRAMDTFKDKISFDRAYARGDAPWELWNKKEHD